MARYEDQLTPEGGPSHSPTGHYHQASYSKQEVAHVMAALSDTASNGSGSPVRTPPNQALPSLAAKRKAASEFLRSSTGVALPYATDQAFRAALKDGVLLCRLANALWPGIVAQVLEAHDVQHGPAGVLRQRDHNCSAFLGAVTQQLPQLPADCVFGIADLEAEHEERPAVANCLLFMRSLAAAGRQQQQPPPPHPTEQGGASSHLSGHSPAFSSHQSDGHLFQHQQHHQQHSSVRGSSEQLLVTPPTHRSSSRLQQHSQQQQAYAGLVTPASLNTPAYGALGGNSPGAMRVSYAGTPGSFSTLLRAGSAGLPLGLPHACPSPLMDGLTHGGGGSSNGGGVPGGMLALRASTTALGLQQQQHGGSYTSAASHKGVAAAAGVTKLMQQCTSMLKERMFPVDAARYSPATAAGGGGGPDSAMKALGPVLEGVLGQLTEEYERRLLSKDHELGQARDARARAEREVARLQEQLERLQREVEDRSAAVVRATADASAADAALLQEQLADALAALAARESELSAARAALSSADSARADAFSALQGETMMLRTRLGELLQIDERYKRVVAENRELYNTVQDLRGNIRVFCRIRPPGVTGDVSPSCVDVGLEGDLAVYEQASGTKRLFKVDRVFNQGVNQEVVYDDTQPLIRSVLDGYNVCIFAYGQTGSGKTHTMSGTDTHQLSGRGINFRALDDLFAIRDARTEECEYTFRVQMLEIYNEVLRDLLVDGRQQQNRLDILATQASGCNVPGAIQVEVHSASDVVTLMARGAAQRATSETKMNDRSSRSHQILTVIVDGFNAATKASSHGCLHLIDLAGSERVGKSEASGDRLVEAQHINKSLSALGDVMAALAAKTPHVPYRNSKLTQLLQDSLQGNAKVMMFMHVSPEANMFGETVSTLKFATRVSQITLGQAKKNVVSGKVFEAHEEVVRQQKDMQTKEQQLSQLQAALQHHQSREAALEAEVQRLRQQLESKAAAGAPDTGSLTARQRSQLQLPLQQMLAAQQQQQQAAAAAQEGGGGGGLSSSAAGAAGSLTNRSAAAGEPVSARARVSSGGGAAAASASGGGGGVGSPVSKIGRVRVDRTPSRDQDECSLPSEPSRTHLELSPLAFPAHYGDGDPTPRTARSTRSTSSAARGSFIPQSRESASAAKHMERLASVRQSGVFRASTSGGGGSPAGAAGAAPGAAAAHSSPGSGLSQMMSRVAAAIGGGSRASTSGGGSRTARDIAEKLPATSRVSGVMRSKHASDGGGSSDLPSFTSRQSGVFGGSSSSGGGGAGARPSGAVTARTMTTSRGGSRWK